MNLNTQNSVGPRNTDAWDQFQSSNSTCLNSGSSTSPDHLVEKSEEQQQLEAVQYFAEASLGVASSLLLALAAKHRPTAMHSIRVALGCSGWAKFRNMVDKDCQEIEIAAALHDLGKIGVSDSILSKPGSLTPEEAFSVESNRQNTLALLSPSLVNKSIAETIYYSIANFDGSKPGFPKSGKDLPIASRMLAIVDAFDSMTTTSHYRSKMNNSEAIAELFSEADKQFDRELVKDFSGYVEANNIWTNPQKSGEWLQPLSSIPQNSNWSLSFNPHSLTGGDSAERNYQKILLETCSDGVAFLDLNGKILLWNRMAENITGLPASDMFDRHWSSDVLDLRDDFNQPLIEDECPVTRVLARKQTLNINSTIRIDQDERRSVELQVVPVFSSSQVLVGVAVVMNDVSSEQSLRQKLKSMTVAATIDPLTQVANRHEFDRVYEQVIACHREENSPFSVIFSDIDFFKRINDDYSHQAGDEALSSFAAHLTRNCRPEDLVSRFGGEEFVILCANSDIQSATERAEAMRSTLQALPQKMLKNRCITASFGVAQLQDGDTGESLLRRADRALLKAKKEGRNRVVSLSGVQTEETEKKKATKSSLFSWLTGRRESDKSSELNKKLVTSVPMEIVIEKIRGFVSDFGAEIQTVQNKTVVFSVNTSKVNLARREGDRACQLQVTIRLDDYEDQDINCEKTMIYLTVKVARAKDRRVPNLNSYLEDMYRCLKSYLVAHEFGVKQTGSLERAATKPGRREN